MRVQLTSTTAVAALLALSGSASAGNVIVGDVYGSYDAQCNPGGNIDCSFGTASGYRHRHGWLVAAHLWELRHSQPVIVNKGTKAFTGLSFTATGYQGINNGITQTISIPNVPGGSILDIVWSAGYAYDVPGSLFNYDYDNSYFQTSSSLSD